jgi:hypothetical protein
VQHSGRWRADAGGGDQGDWGQAVGTLIATSGVGVRHAWAQSIYRNEENSERTIMPMPLEGHMLWWSLGTIAFLVAMPVFMWVLMARAMKRDEEANRNR